MIKDIPLYECKINEDENAFVEAIALVESPAIESDFIAFSQHQKDLTFSLNDEMMELIGAAMIPDKNIYRKDKAGQEYYVYFSKDTIRKIVQVFSKKGFQTNINLEHNENSPANSFVFQSYIVDETKGMTSPTGLNLPDGSWVVGVKVTDSNVWADIKAGKIKGFSVEGLFELFESDLIKNSDEYMEQCLALIKKINSQIEKIKNINI